MRVRDIDGHLHIFDSIVCLMHNTAWLQGTNETASPC